MWVKMVHGGGKWVVFHVFNGVFHRPPSAGREKSARFARKGEFSTCSSDVFDYAIDAKGRLNFPAKFREGMGETFIVARWLDHCLAAFPMAEFEQVAQRIAEKGLVKGRQVSRMLYSSTLR